MRVINLFGGPGCGKSTTAAELFALMKHAGKKVELITEYAKDLAYERNLSRLDNQFLVIAEQYHRLIRVKDSVDFAITDSPLFLGLIYAKNPPSWLHDAILGSFREFDNVNYILRRTKPFATYGRIHSEEQSIDIDTQIRSLLNSYTESWVELNGDAKAAKTLLSWWIFQE